MTRGSSPRSLSFWAIAPAHRAYSLPGGFSLGIATSSRVKSTISDCEASMASSRFFWSRDMNQSCQKPPALRRAARGGQGAALYAPAVVFDGFSDGLVLLGEAHQFEPDGVDQCGPTGFDDVVGNARGGPVLVVVRPFDQHADLGRRPLVRIEHADFVIHKPHVGNLRV